MSPVYLPDSHGFRHGVVLVRRALTVSDILCFEMFYLENFDKGHGVQLSQCSHSMANINIYIKVVSEHFFTRSSRFPDICNSNIVTLKM